MFDYRGLLYCADNVARDNAIAFFYIRFEFPLFIVVERRYLHTATYTVSRHFEKFIKRTLYPVVYAFDKSRRKFDRQRHFGAYYLLSASQTARLFVYLNRRFIAP